MSHFGHLALPLPRSSSPIVLADRLLALAEDADRAGLRLAAGRILKLAHDVLDRPPPAFIRAAAAD